MTEKREMIIPYGELAIVSVQCPVCEAALVVDFSNPKQERVWQDNAAIVCGVCRAPLDSGLKEGFESFRQWRTSAKKSGLEITFRVSVTD
jgi:hypothetical protein